MPRVYQYTNKITGDRYIGYTSLSQEKRFSRHLYDAKRGSPYHFHRAIMCYGPESFECSILFESDNKEQTFLMEKKLIEQNNPEYNIAVGGLGGDTFKNLSLERKSEIAQKISSTNKELWKDPIRLERNRNNAKKTFELCRKLTDEEVIDIRSNGLSHAKNAKKYGVSKITIYRIMHRFRYK